MKPIDAPALREMLADDQELALLDAREEGVFGASHLFYASCAPLSRLELFLPRLVPRTSARIVFCDAGEGLAGRAARRAAELGYSRVMVLDGGNEAATRAGFELFSGVNVPSKSFGEYVEITRGTPSMSADELRQALDAGEDVLVLDSRPFAEYTVRNIPGGISCPGAELAYRVHDLLPGPGTRVVVNCAGRTRSIIGAQSLINAGVRNPVAALRNGTMGWHLAGYALEEGASRIAPDPSADGLARSLEAAREVAERFAVPSIDMTTLARWQQERDCRSLFLLDVRHPHEYASAHLPTSVNAPGGQLVQETDQFVGTLKSRVVLVDDNGVRATMTAAWLIQMGWRDVNVLRGGLEADSLEHGNPVPPVLGLERAAATAMSVDTLTERLREGSLQIVDLSTHLEYRAGHVPGAAFAQRAELATILPGLGAPQVLFCSSDGRLARLAAAECSAADVAGYLDGGNEAWVAAGQPLQGGAGRALCAATDRYMRPYEKEWGNPKDMSDYLTWEVALVPKLERDGTAMFLGH